MSIPGPGCRGLDEGIGKVHGARMSAHIRLWIRSSHHPALLSGGWAYVRRLPAGEITGQAGGARNTTAGRTALSGLGAALAELPPGPLALDTGDPSLDARLMRVAQGLSPFADDEAPADLELWAPLVRGLQGRTLVRLPAETKGPAAFAQAWAELSRDRAKDRGAFAAAIPRPNLAKLTVS